MSVSNNVEFLQQRLTARRQECVQLGRERDEAIRAAELANEVADNVERELEAMEMAYDALREVYIEQTLSMHDWRNVSIFDFFLYKFGAWIAKSSQTTEDYYSIATRKHL